jgi:hypothetical protein
MHPQLQSVLDDLSAVRERFARLAAATPDDQWSRRATPDAWSVAECIAHLNLTARAMQPLLDRASAEARALGSAAGRLRRSAFGAVLGAMVGPVPGWGRTRFGRVRTPPTFVPTGDLPRHETVAEFERHLDVHEAALRAADGLPLDKVKVASPFVPGASYDAYSAWIILARHAHRHLAQAERVWGAG